MTFVPSSRETAATTIRKTYPTMDSRNRNSKGDELVNVEEDDYTNDGAKDDYVVMTIIPRMTTNN